MFVSACTLGRYQRRDRSDSHQDRRKQLSHHCSDHTHLPEQRETHHLIQMLRHESNKSHLDDLSHIASEYCLADPLTKSTAKPDQLVSSITTGKLENVDVHPPFRSLLKHKAFFLTTWVIETLSEPHNLLTFFCEDISDYVFAMMYFEE